MLFLFPCLTLCLSFSCQSQNADASADTAIPAAMELTVESGEHWLGKMKAFIFSVQKTPQMAAWIEDEAGRYISTITVTGRSAGQKWRGAPKEGRPEALPVWNHRSNNSAANTVDTVSTATPKSPNATAINKSALVDGNTYTVYLEINHSFDYNDTWTKENSGVNGQPSIIYQAQFTAGQPGRIPLVPMGHGSVDGSDGNIVNEIEHFSSALNIVQNAYITVNQ
jgi:hypothetical protein